MTSYEEGIKLVEQAFGNGKDNLICLATIAKDNASNGQPCPSARTIDAYYEDGVFYCVTYQNSNKMLQIANNSNVAVAANPEMFTASAVAENLGWVLDPRNATIRAKLRKTFAAWYDMANDENDHNCCILAIRLTKGIYNYNHWEKLFPIDFINHTIIEDGQIH